MWWLIAGVTLAFVAMAATWGTLSTAAILLAAVAWLLVAFRPTEAGALVANWSRKRFE